MTMNNKRQITMHNKGRPVVQNNGYDGCIYICPPEDSKRPRGYKIAPSNYKIKLLQIDIQDQNNTIVEVRQEVDVIKTNLIEALRVLHGDTMAGEIRTYRQNSPIDNDDPMLHLMIGTNGKAYWEYKEYTEEHLGIL